MNSRLIPLAWTPALVLILAAAFHTLAPVGADTAPPRAAGEWQSLFNGENLAGWRLYGKKQPPGEGWKVEDGILKKVGGVRGGDIITEETFEDFEFSWEWRIDPRGNNGIKYLVTESRPSAPGHEYQLLDDTGHPDGNVGPKRQTASFYDVLPPAANKPMRAIGEWNSSKIVVHGVRIEHWLNGEKVLAYELGSPRVQEALAASKFKDSSGFGDKVIGHIMLTDHQDECWFRNLKVRRL